MKEENRERPTTELKEEQNCGEGKEEADRKRSAMISNIGTKDRLSEKGPFCR